MKCFVHCQKNHQCLRDLEHRHGHLFRVHLMELHSPKEGKTTPKHDQLISTCIPHRVCQEPCQSKHEAVPASFTTLVQTILAYSKKPCQISWLYSFLIPCSAIDKDKVVSLKPESPKGHTSKEEANF